MPSNKSILETANAAITTGDYEGFLAHCSEDTTWTFVGEQTLRGKAAVREWMATAYTEPPQFHVESLIEDGDFVVALGSIMAPDKAGDSIPHRYCDVWRVRDGKLAALQAFVIAPAAEKGM